MTAARLVLIGLAFVYVNLSLAVGFYAYEALPRILNALVGMFVAPIALLVVFNLLAGRILSGLKLEIDNEDAPVTAMGVVAISLWLGLLAGNYLGVQDHVVLSLGDHAEGLDPAQAPDHAQAVYLSFASGAVAREQIGLERQTSRVKAADVVTLTYHDYTAVPWVADGWDASQPISLWLCVHQFGLEQLPADSVIASALAQLPADATAESPLRAVALRDPATRSNCLEAVARSLEATGTSAHPQALLLQRTELSRAQLIDERRRRFWIFVVICNVLWLLPAVFVRLSAK